jgi:uncharacterized membrane protein YagU involved in acid resistance
MATVAKLSWPRILTRGVVAGIVGGILMDLFIYLTSVLPQHGSMIAVWQFIASTAIGKGAFSSTSFAWFGLLMHFIVSIAWATGYAYLAQTRAALSAHPAISGVVFGIVVYVVMQIVLVGDNNFKMPSPAGFVLSLVAHAVFFGLPVAYVVRAQTSPA